MRRLEGNLAADLSAAQTELIRARAEADLVYAEKLGQARMAKLEKETQAAVMLAKSLALFEDAKKHTEKLEARGEAPCERRSSTSWLGIEFDLVPYSRDPAPQRIEQENTTPATASASGIKKASRERHPRGREAFLRLGRPGRPALRSSGSCSPSCSSRVARGAASSRSSARGPCASRAGRRSRPCASASGPCSSRASRSRRRLARASSACPPGMRWREAVELRRRGSSRRTTRPAALRPARPRRRGTSSTARRRCSTSRGRREGGDWPLLEVRTKDGNIATSASRCSYRVKPGEARAARARRPAQRVPPARQDARPRRCCWRSSAS